MAAIATHLQHEQLRVVVNPAMLLMGVLIAGEEKSSLLERKKCQNHSVTDKQMFACDNCTDDLLRTHVQMTC